MHLLVILTSSCVCGRGVGSERRMEGGGYNIPKSGEQKEYIKYKIHRACQTGRRCGIIKHIAR